MKALSIASGQGDYGVSFVDSLESLSSELRSIESPLFAVDRNVFTLYEPAIRACVNSSPLALIDPTEEEKTLDGVGRLTETMRRSGSNKRTTLVAIGGGIVQDIATFSAHIYFRGISWICVPTTLLSMSDSCIGAKCGINLGSLKNQLGVFHAPSRVLVHSGFLGTLADVDIRSGHGEILKLMLTGSEEGFARLKCVVDAEGLNGATLNELIVSSLEAKKAIIEVDEYERDRRRLLNYGHSFGHALEALTNYAVPHGLAVAWGIDLINFISMRMGLMQEAAFEAVHEFVRAHLSFVLPHGIQSTELIAGVRSDKKAAGGRINLVLSCGPGRLLIRETVIDAELEAHVEEYVRGFNAFPCG